MYKAYFGFTSDPFSKEVENKNFYKSYQFNQALNRLDFLKQNKGFGLITGEPGAGKSSLLRYFKENLNPNLFKCVYIPLTTLTVMDFYRALCDGLGVEPACKKVTIFNQIQESIHNYSINKNITPVIIIDEVQFIKNSVLDDLRIIFNFKMDSKDLAIVILTGQTNFIHQINRSNHEALRQRIAISYNLEGLTCDEVKDYVTSRLRVAGYSEPIFADDCFELIHSMTNGHLREINSIARMCLVSAASKGVKSITKEDVFNAHNEVSIIVK
ncbi:MAG: ExeA family protein, partial [Paraclostridium sp.]